MRGIKSRRASLTDSRTFCMLTAWLALRGEIQRVRDANWLLNLRSGRDRDKLHEAHMNGTLRQILLIACCVPLAGIVTLGPAKAAQAPQSRPPSRVQAAPPTTITVDGSEAMFTTMCVLLAAGFESDVSAANWHPLRAQLRERMQHQQGPAVDAAREFYKAHQLVDASAMLSQYIWFGLVSGPAPAFRSTLRRDELPPEVIALEGFSEILAAYHKEQKIGGLWRELQPIYNREIDHLHDSVS